MQNQDQIRSDRPIAHSGSAPVPPVPPVPQRSAHWGPPWLAELSANTPHLPRQQHHSRGWRLANGTVVCASCQARPADATAVVLANAADGVVWVEDPGTTKGGATNNTAVDTPPSPAAGSTQVSHDPLPRDTAPAPPKASSLGEGWL
jgi:hypothetical protein